MKVIIYVKNLHSCHKISPNVKDFLAKIKLQKDGLLSAVEPAFAECRPAVDLLPGRVWYAVGTEQSLHRRAGNTKQKKLEMICRKSFLLDCKCG